MVRKIPEIKKELTREELIERNKELDREVSDFLKNLYRFYDQPRGENFRVRYRTA